MFYLIFFNFKSYLEKVSFKDDIFCLHMIKGYDFRKKVKRRCEKGRTQEVLIFSHVICHSCKSTI